MKERNRGLLFAISNEDIIPSTVDNPVDTPIEDIVIDPDHPETIEHLSLIEYCHLVAANATEVPYADAAPQPTQEGFAESAQNFKSWFKRTMSKDATYIDELEAQFKELVPRIQASNDKPTAATPVSMFGDYAVFLEYGGKQAQNPQQILGEVKRLFDLNTAIDKAYLPSFAAEIKYAMDCVALGVQDIEAAYKKIYVLNKVNDPTKGFEHILTEQGTATLGSGKKVVTKDSPAYFGSLRLQAYPLGDSAGLNIDRGYEMLTDLHPSSKDVSRVQIKAATRDELKQIADVALKALSLAHSYIEKMQTAERSMLIDKINGFENAHRNWRKYPQEERRKIVTILNVADSTTDRVHVVHDVLFATRRGMHAVQRYIEMCLQRLA